MREEEKPRDMAKNPQHHHRKSNNGGQEAQRCPRCDSSNTKFCYYNNYSLSQPRYFCKSCRRYWTHGGTLRNVPVGGGSRKGKRDKTSVISAATNAQPPSSSAPPQQTAVGSSHHHHYDYVPSLAAIQTSFAHPHSLHHDLFSSPSAMSLLQGFGDASSSSFSTAQPGQFYLNPNYSSGTSSSHQAWFRQTCDNSNSNNINTNTSTATSSETAVWNIGAPNDDGVSGSSLSHWPDHLPGPHGSPPP